MNLDVNTKTGVSKAAAVNVAALWLLLSLIFTCLLISEGEAAHRSLSISLSTINYVSLLLSLACTLSSQNELTNAVEGIF